MKIKEFLPWYPLDPPMFFCMAWKKLPIFLAPPKKQRQKQKQKQKQKQTNKQKNNYYQ